MMASPSHLAFHANFDHHIADKPSRSGFVVWHANHSPTSRPSYIVELPSEGGERVLAVAEPQQLFRMPRSESKPANVLGGPGLWRTMGTLPAFLKVMQKKGLLNDIK